MKSFDLVVIGGGPGGYPAAIRAAQKGLSVALIEKGELGGTCLHRGCIPSKAYIAAAEILMKSRSAEKIGIFYDPPRIDYQKLVQSKEGKVQKLMTGINGLLKGNKIELIQGEGRLVGAGKVQVNGEEIAAKNSLLATGSEPVRPSSFSFDGESILTTDELFRLPSLPKRLLVIGGGVIGCEMACAYNLLGSEVTLVEFLPEILPQEGGLVSRSMKTVFEKRGIHVKTGVKVESLVKKESVLATLSDGESFEVDVALVAIGRRFEDRLGLAHLGIKIEKGFVSVDPFMQTSLPGVYAVGDITGQTLLAHGATAQGLCAIAHMTGHPTPLDYSSVPRVTYTLPEVASIGFRESELKEKGIPYRTGRFSYLASGMAILHEETDGFAEIYVGGDRKVLGAVVMGAQASQLIQQVALLRRNNLPIEAVTETVYAHPTLAEILHEAAEDVDGLAIHKIGAKR